MLRIVLDTNVIISAYIHKKFSRLVYDYCTDSHLTFVSDWLINELRIVLKGKFQIPDDIIASVVQAVLKRSTLIDPITPIPNICRDPDDNNLLKLCDSILSDYLITGDNDLLMLTKHGRCSIVTPRGFYDRIITGGH